ncbi:hypothetical protein NOJ05_00235 [Neorhizobium galegae]|nr:hypothetical protein [Neorhizobium galegae]MCQ1775629.1 hypothetical protein [Neorhizobium galegae]MCQ1798103.1 hypothetical protein [Neorhizobium galegae]CDZ29109.1 Hypothetical protein NGAL_HAMBI490_39710 [Neorhizobium galegae bv. officinalis]
MPRYYFHVRTAGVLEIDPDGTEFATPALAYDEAVKGAREMMGEKVAKGEIVDGETFEITSESGEVIAILPFKSVVRFE